MGAIASQITSLTIVYSTVNSGADQSKHQSSASLAFVWGIHRGPVNSPHKWPVTRKMFPFDDVIMLYWKLLIDTYFNQSICQFQQFCGIIARECSCCCRTSARLAGRFDCLMSSLILIAMDNGRGLCAWWQFCKVPNQTHRGVENWKNVYHKTN